MVRSFCLWALFSMAFLALTGCSSTDPDEGNDYVAVQGPVGDLYRLYFESGLDPDSYVFDVFLYLDPVNVPNERYSYPYLHLLNEMEPAGLWGATGFDYYEYEEIPEDSDFPSDPDWGWKVRIQGASVSVCETCYTNDGLLKLLSLHGDRDAVEFVWDPEDTLQAYVRAVEVESNTKWH